MEKYDEDALRELCSKVDLLEYASKTMNFEKRGSNSYATNCCLHQDLTPSLFITPSRNQFYCQSCHVGGSILKWLMTYENMSFPDAVRKASELAGVDIANLKTCESLSVFKAMRDAVMSSRKNIVKRKILDADYMNCFVDEVPQEWIDEGISAETMKKFGIRIDNKSNRIVYPVYDADFNLIGVKGRTRFPNYKLLKLRKYQNYQKIGTTDYFSGMKENYDEIMQQKSAIIFEGLKSVMKLYDWQWKNAIAAETSVINDAQKVILIKMQLKEITFALDNDVQLSKIRKNAEKLRRYMRVYAVIDNKKILSSNKMAPCDDGKKKWEQLYEERIAL